MRNFSICVEALSETQLYDSLVVLSPSFCMEKRRIVELARVKKEYYSLFSLTRATLRFSVFHVKNWRKRKKRIVELSFAQGFYTCNIKRLMCSGRSGSCDQNGRLEDNGH